MVLLVITRPQSRSPLVLDTKEKVVRMWLTKVEEVKMLLLIKLEDDVVNEGSGYVDFVGSDGGGDGDVSDKGGGGVH